jgi:DNA polymerase III delta prime subunit
MKYHLKALKRAHEKEKLAHAYLLSGNDVAGKESLIQEFITFLLGPKKAGILANVVEVSPQKDEITIGQIRRLKEQLSLSAWASPYKIGIIRLAETMNQEAQSAFLKLLEEPRGNVLLFLVVQHPALLLDTIRSRTQELKMYRFDKSGEKRTNLLSKLRGSSIAERFSFAQRQSQDQKALYETLVNLQQEARLQFLKELHEGTLSSLNVLRTLKEVLLALRQTNVNGRLAIERILLEL